MLSPAEHLEHSVQRLRPLLCVQQSHGVRQIDGARPVDVFEGAGIGQADYSYSIAVGIIRTFVSLILLFTANGISKKIRGYSIV